MAKERADGPFERAEERFGPNLDPTWTQLGPNFGPTWTDLPLDKRLRSILLEEQKALEKL